MTLLPIHIIAGVIGLVSGAVALSVRKGGKLHRKGGMIFVYSMTIVAITGTVMGLLISEMAAVIPGMLTFYLVLTSFLTVHRPVALKFSWIDFGAMLLGLTVGIASFSYAFVADGQPTVLYIIFGTVALLATLGDIRMMLARRIQHRSGTGVSGVAPQFRTAAHPCALSVAPNVLLVGARSIYPMVSTLTTTVSSQPFCFTTCCSIRALGVNHIAILLK